MGSRHWVPRTWTCFQVCSKYSWIWDGSKLGTQQPENEQDLSPPSSFYRSSTSKCWIFAACQVRLQSMLVYTGFIWFHQIGKGSHNHPIVILLSCWNPWVLGYSASWQRSEENQVFCSKPQQSEMLASTSMIGGLLHGNQCEDPDIKRWGSSGANLGKPPKNWWSNSEILQKRKDQTYQKSMVSENPWFQGSTKWSICKSHPSHRMSTAETELCTTAKSSSWKPSNFQRLSRRPAIHLERNLPCFRRYTAKILQNAWELN